MTLLGHIDPVWAVKLAEDLKFIVSGSNNFVKIWHFGESRVLASFDTGNSIVYCVDSRFDSKYAASGGNDKQIRYFFY